jgi:hypothetical protein
VGAERLAVVRPARRIDTGPFPRKPGICYSKTQSAKSKIGMRVLNAATSPLNIECSGAQWSFGQDK